MRSCFSTFRTLTCVALLCLASLLNTIVLYGQENDSTDYLPKPDHSIGETKGEEIIAEPDTNFTFEKYEAFLKIISDTSRFTVVPLKDFRNTVNPKKVIVGLRHDLDISLSHALAFSETEWKHGLRSTYYILHTAPYYLKKSTDMAVHDESIIPTLQRMQIERNFEIGWHSDLVTLQLIYNIDPVSFLKNELAWLRSYGIDISGSASHGSPYCYTYKYLNYYFFEECTFPVVTGFENNISVQKDGKVIPLAKGKLQDFGLTYEAYFLNNNKYFSDAAKINGERWHISMLKTDQLVPGDRVIVLTHPVHWHKASVLAEIETFSIQGQNSASIDASTSSVTVKMPYGTNPADVKPFFRLSPGAIARVNGTIQTAGVTRADLSSPLVYSVIAENRNVRKNWTVNLLTEKNSAAAFKSYVVPGATKSVRIDAINRKVLLELTKGTDISAVPVQFELSHGARAWIRDIEQFSNHGTVDLSNDVVYRIVAEDEVTQNLWTISASFITDVNDTPQAEEKLTVYPNPSDGILFLQFRDVKSTTSRIEIFNLAGEKIYSESISKSGSFTHQVDLSNESPGVYVVRNLNTGQRILVVIQ